MRISVMKPQTPPSAASSPDAAVEKDDRALRQACREFESLLVAQMLKQMRASVPKSDLFGSREKEEMFQSMLDDELAKGMSEQGAFKLGDVIYDQLARRKDG